MILDKQFLDASTNSTSGDQHSYLSGVLCTSLALETHTTLKNTLMSSKSSAQKVESNHWAVRLVTVSSTGLEPAVFGFGDRRLIHQATRISQWVRRHFCCSVSGLGMLCTLRGMFATKKNLIFVASFLALLSTQSVELIALLLWSALLTIYK